VSTTRFDPDGKPVRENRANGTYTLYGYTNRDWLSSIQHFKSDGSLLDSLQYFYTDGGAAYDPTGRLRREVDAGGRTHEFFYNRHSELTAETHPDVGSATYTLDANGNRTAWTKAGVTAWAGYDAQNKLLWTNSAANTAPTPGQAQPYRLYQYDLAGQPTQVDRRDLQGGPLSQERFEWDGMGKLRRVFDLVGGVERYRADYDGGGERVRAVSNGVTRTYSGGLHEDDSNGDTATYTPGVSQRKNGVDSYFHSDWIGSTRYLTGANGLTTPSAYRFDGFGNVSAFAGTDLTRFKFAGGHGYESDAHGGLQQLGARLYDPVVGRFISPDPIGFAGGLHLYEYCGGNPVGLVDPGGLRQTKPWWQQGLDALAYGVSLPGRAVVGVLDKLTATKLKPGTPRLGSAYIDEAFSDEPDIYASRRGLRRAGAETKTFLQEQKVQIANQAFYAAVSVAAAARAAGCSATGATQTVRLAPQLTQKGLEHIVVRHWATSGALGAGKFAPGTRLKDLVGLIDETAGNGAWQPDRFNRWRIEHTFGRQIGVNINGQPSSRLRLIVEPTGEVVTAFPI
jgi:RHS repeat-associated protein